MSLPFTLGSRVVTWACQSVLLILKVHHYRLTENMSAFVGKVLNLCTTNDVTHKVRFVGSQTNLVLGHDVQAARAKFPSSHVHPPSLMCFRSL